jgi:hypothetical protein
VGPIEEAWARLEAQWEDDEAHRRFIGLCVAMDQLPEAGRHYRQVRESDAARAEEAAQRIESLLVLATQQLTDTRSRVPPKESKRALTWAAFLMMLLLMGSVIWILSRGLPLP